MTVGVNVDFDAAAAAVVVSVHNDEAAGPTLGSYFVPKDSREKCTALTMTQLTREASTGGSDIAAPEHPHPKSDPR